MSRQSRELKKQQERAKKYGCDGRCYWSTGMCPSVEICDETRVGEAIATAIGLITRREMRCRKSMKNWRTIDQY